MEKHMQQRKKRELKKKTLIKLVRLNSANESRKFYKKKINYQRRGFNPG